MEKKPLQHEELTRRILEGVVGRKIVLKNETLIFRGDADAKVVDFEFSDSCAISDRHVNSASIRRVFDCIAQETFDNFRQYIRRNQYHRRRFAGKYDLTRSVRKTRAQGIEVFTHELR